jgi:hypothetical protein
MNEKPRMTCEIRGCFESVEYDPNDMRPWIYHITKDGVHHCAGANPNLKQNKKPYYSKPATKQRPKDHILREYYGYGHKTRRVEDEEEIQEEDGQSDNSDA